MPLGAQPSAEMSNHKRVENEGTSMATQTLKRDSVARWWERTCHLPPARWFSAPAQTTAWLSPNLSPESRQTPQLEGTREPFTHSLCSSFGSTGPPPCFLPTLLSLPITQRRPGPSSELQTCDPPTHSPCRLSTRDALPLAPAPQAQCHGIMGACLGRA